MTAIIIFIYLAAAVGANLTVTAFGEHGAYLTAFLIIPLDLIIRDILHEKWSEKIWLRMGLLIATGSALSAIVVWDSRIVAVASFAAFAAGGLTNTFAYQKLISKPRLLKMNASNLPAAFIDSIVFAGILFEFDGAFIVAQTAIKFVGGIMWSIIWVHIRAKLLTNESTFRRQL